MTEATATSPTTTKWLWLIVSFFAWGFVLQLLPFVAFSIPVSAAWWTPYVHAALTVPPAWLLARLAIRRGAPASIWIPVAVMSGLYAALSGVATVVFYFVDTEVPLSPLVIQQGTIALAGSVLLGVTPTLTVFREGRRLTSRLGADSGAPEESDYSPPGT